MSTREAIQRFLLKGEAIQQRILKGTAETAFSSIRDGSPITGAPGQPVDKGTLYESWTLRFADANHAVIETKLFRAIFIEDNVGKYKFKNHGPHSFKLTVAGLDRIVQLEVEQAISKGKAA
jgi:hypothetical protein